MLERAVAGVKTDEAKAPADFRNGANGFRDHDLHVFCAGLDDKINAHVDPRQIARTSEARYDIDGVAFGQESNGYSTPRIIKAVTYVWPKPSLHVPVNR